MQTAQSMKAWDEVVRAIKRAEDKFEQSMELSECVAHGAAVFEDKGDIAKDAASTIQPFPFEGSEQAVNKLLRAYETWVEVSKIFTATAEAAVKSWEEADIAAKEAEPLFAIAARSKEDLKRLDIWRELVEGMGKQLECAKKALEFAQLKQRAVVVASEAARSMKS